MMVVGTVGGMVLRKRKPYVLVWESWKDLWQMMGGRDLLLRVQPGLFAVFVDVASCLEDVWLGRCPKLVVESGTEDDKVETGLQAVPDYAAHRFET